MIRGMALAARYLDQPEYAKSATSAVDFIRNTMWRDGRLLATCKDGKAHLNAYLDDYAFLLDALLELLQTRWRTDDLSFAIELADALLAQFEDTDQGGFWFTAHDHEQLIQRIKTYADDALPNGNGVAAFALQRLGYLLGETRYLDAAERALKNAWAGINQSPMAHCAMLKALEEYLDAPQTVIIRGAERALAKLQGELGHRYQPRRQVFFIPDTIPDLPDMLAAKTPQQQVVAYRCKGMSCAPPVYGDEILKTIQYYGNTPN